MTALLKKEIKFTAILAAVIVIIICVFQILKADHPELCVGQQWRYCYGDKKNPFNENICVTYEVLDLKGDYVQYKITEDGFENTGIDLIHSDTKNNFLHGGLLFKQCEGLLIKQHAKQITGIQIRKTEYAYGWN